MEDDRHARRRERRARHDTRRLAEENEEPASENEPENDTVEAQIRRRVEKRLKEREAFLRHLVSFVSVNAMLWIIWAVTSRGFPWPIFVTLGWGVGLVSNALQVYQNSARVAMRREESIQREIEREKERLGLADEYEKPKRDRTMRLSDDGELVPADEDEDNGLVSKAKRG
jgi:2TM domain